MATIRQTKRRTRSVVENLGSLQKPKYWKVEWVVSLRLFTIAVSGTCWAATCHLLSLAGAMGTPEASVAFWTVLLPGGICWAWPRERVSQYIPRKNKHSTTR